MCWRHHVPCHQLSESRGPAHQAQHTTTAELEKATADLQRNGDLRTALEEEVARLSVELDAVLRRAAEGGEQAGEELRCCLDQVCCTADSLCCENKAIVVSNFGL